MKTENTKSTFHIPNYASIESIKSAIEAIETGTHKIFSSELRSKFLNNLYSKLEILEAKEVEKKYGVSISNIAEKRIAKDIESYITEYVKADTVNICAVNVIAEVLKLVLMSNTLAPSHVNWLDLKAKLDKILIEAM